MTQSESRLHAQRITQQLLNAATYADGEATVPAYLLEQLADVVGVELTDRSYTDETSKERNSMDTRRRKVEP